MLRVRRRQGGRAKRKRRATWSAVVKPDVGVPWLAAAALVQRSVPLAVELFHLIDQAWAPQLNEPHPRATVAARQREQGRELTSALPGLRLTGDLATDFVHAGAGLGSLLEEVGAGRTTFARSALLAPLDDLSAALITASLRGHVPPQSLTATADDAASSDRNDSALHILARHGAHRSVGAFTAMLGHADEDDGYGASLVEALHGALHAVNSVGRTPLHVAAVLHGPHAAVTRALHDLACHLLLPVPSTTPLPLPLPLPNDGGAGAAVWLETPRDVLGDTAWDCLWRFANKTSPRPPKPRSGKEGRQDQRGQRDGDNGGANGGWGATRAALSHAHADDVDQRCDIDVREADSVAERDFHRKYVLENRPLVVRGAVPAAVQRVWTRAEMLQRHGHENVSVGDIPYWQRFHRPGRTTTLAEYVGSWARPDRAEYAFSSEPCTAWAKHSDGGGGVCDLALLPAFVRAVARHAVAVDSFGRPMPSPRRPPHRPAASTEVHPQLFLGPAGTGAPFHFHHDAVNVLVHGERRWFLQPPLDANYSIEPPAAWLLAQAHHRDPPSGGGRPFPLECTQMSGDMIFVPADWGHATMNVVASAGVAFEMRLREGS